MVLQAFVYGDSLRSQLVAVVVPDPEVLLPWAKERGIHGEANAEVEQCSMGQGAGCDARTAGAPGLAVRASADGLAPHASHVLIRYIAYGLPTTAFPHASLGVPPGQPPPIRAPHSLRRLHSTASNAKPATFTCSIHFANATPIHVSLTPPPSTPPRPLQRHHGGAVRQPARARRGVQEHAGAGAGGAAAGLRAGAGGGRG